MTGAEPPLGADGSPLSPQEWEAVRRLRAERAETPEQEPVVTDPSTPEQSWSEAPSARAARAVPLVNPVLTAAMAALVLVAVVAAALVAVVSVRLSDKRGQAADATAALAAATGGVTSVLSYNYKSLDADFTKAESLLTPAFRKKYVTTTARAVQPLAAKYHAVSTAQVTSGGVISSSGGRVQVLVFVSQQVTNSQLSAPRLDRSRVIVALKHTGGRWLIDNLTPV